MNSTKPAVLVITSTVVRGSVGGRAAVFALERLGFPVWSVQTVTLPWHPGQGRAGRIVPDEAAFAELIDNLKRSPRLGEIGAILTGYLGAASQAEPIAGLVDAVRAERPNLLYLCDPVMGDQGTLYVPQATAEAIRDRLVPRADVVTPNPTELAFLASAPLGSLDEQIAGARALRPARVAITSALSERGSTDTLLIGRSSVLCARHAQIEGRTPNGTGDLFAALLLGRLLEKRSDSDALRLATGGVLAALEAARRLGVDELPLAAMQDELVDPQAAVSVDRDG